MVVFRPFGTIASTTETNAKPRVDYVSPRVLLVGLFDGISGMIVALARLPIAIMGLVSCDIDENTRRLMGRRWPGLIAWNNITHVNRRDAENRGAVLAPICDFVLVAAGSPCQDLSSLNFGGKGLNGSKSALFFEMPRVLELLNAELDNRVQWLVEKCSLCPALIDESFPKLWVCALS